MKPIIGITPLWDDEKKSLWMLPGYMNGIREAGGLPIILPMTSDPGELQQVSSICNGFLFTGGHDVSTQIYGEDPLPGIVEACKDRDDMELQLLDIALERDLPVLGICRGIQFLNAALGGTLYQDLPTQHPSEVDHHMSPPYDKTAHTVNVYFDTPLYELVQNDRIGVNSYHHQAVKIISPQLKAMAKSDDDLIEAVYMPEKKFVWALQWHPEFSYETDAYSKQIFLSFVKKCIQ